MRLNSHSPALLTSIFLLALSLRLAYIFQIRKAVVSSILVGDGYVYDQWAQRIASGDWFGEEVFYQAPLYPYFLACIYAVFGHSLLIVRTIQAIGGATACVFLALAGRSFFSARVGLLAAVLLAIYSPALFFDGLIQKAGLDLFLMASLLFLLGKLHTGARGLWLPATGAVMGLLSLNRENALVVIVPVAFWLAFQELEARSWRRLLPVGLVTAGFALILVPVGFRNLAVGGEFFLTTAQFGPNFFIGNNEQANGQYQPLRWGRGSALTERQDATELAEAAEGRPLTPGEVSRYWTVRAVHYIVRHPGAWLRLMVRKYLLVWNGKELTDSEDSAIYHDYSTVLRGIGRFAQFVAIAPLALLGLWTMRSQRQLWLLYFILASMTGAIALFFVFARYRYPVVPLLLMFASAGIWSVLDSLKRREFHQTLRYVGILLIAGGVVKWPLTPPDAPRATSYYNLGVSLAGARRFDEATRFYSKALTIDPTFLDPRVMLGNALISLNRLDEAVVQFQIALEQAPENALVHNNLAIALVRQGRHEEAARHYREALRIQPDFAGAREGLARISRK